MSIQPIRCWTYDRYGALTGHQDITPETDTLGSLIYRLPKWSTVVQPIKVAPGSRPVFLEKTQSWIEVSDHRGETWFDYMGRPQTIERLGNPALWDLLPEDPRGRANAG